MTNCLRLMAFLLLACCHQSLCAADEWLGTEVFFKDTAVAMVGTEVVDKYKVLAFPATVGEVNGEWLWLGRAWVKKSDCMNLQQAFNNFDEAVRKTPTSASAWSNRAIAWRQKGELNNAIKDFDEAIRLDPKYAIAYCNRGIAKSMLKDFAAAIKDYDEAIRLDPKYAFAYNNRGNAKGDLEENAAAIKDYDEAIRIDPKYAHAYRNRGISKVIKEDFTAAIKDFDEAIRLDPKFAFAYGSRAYVKSELRDFAAAIADYNEAIRFGPKLAFTYASRGNAKSQLSDYAGAIKDYDEAIRLDPTDISSYIWRGITKDELRDYAGAIRDYDEAVRLDPKNAEAYSNRGVAKSNLQDYAGAIKDYDEVIRLDPKNINAYGNRGTSKRLLQDYAGAIEDFDQVIRLDPKNSYAYFSRGSGKYSLRDYAGAIEDYNEAIRLDPKYVAAYNNRGIAKSKLQDFVGAIKDYDEAIRLDPKNVNAHLVRGMAKDDMRDYAGAIKDYDEAIRIDPKRPSAKNNKAFLLSTAEDARVRNPDLALKLAEEVLSVDPSNAEATNAKSCALAAKGDYTSAIALQESITDTAWLKNDSVVGGVHAKARITAWKSGKLWHASEGIARESLATITNVSNTSSCSIFQECQADAHGNVHLAWVDGSSDLGILYSRWDGMTWSPPTNVLNRSVVSVAPSMAIAPSGKVHLVCMMGGQFDCDIYYSELLDDTWSKPINISNLKGISQCPKIALDSAGILHVAWFDNTNGHLELFHCRREAETWLPPVNTNLVLGQLADDTEMLISPGLAADHQGQLHLVWGDRIVESATPENDLFYSCWRDGVWSKPEQISQKQGQPTRPAICTDAAGNLHVTWQDYFSESWYCSKLGEKWSEPLNFCPEMQDAGLPAICPGPNGEIHLAWTGGEEETPQIFYRRFQEGSWSETVRVTNNPFGAVFPKIAFDAKGKLHLTWMDWSRSNSEIFHCRGIPADQPRVRRPRSDEAETLRPFVRGDFQEIISYPNRADLPESVVISQPRGEFVKIDVTASNEILRSLLNTDPTAQQQALKEVLAAPNAYAPPALYATANAMFQLGKEDEALFWYYLGLLRATSDAYKYKSPDGSVQDAVYLLNKKFGPPFQEMFRTDWQKTIAIVEKVIAWDRQNARAYNPKWIALAGTDAFSKFFVPFASDDIWLRIDRETRQEFFGEFQDMLRAAEISDKNRDQRLNEDEKDAFDDTLTQLLQVNSRGVLKHNLKDYEGAIKDFDEVVRIDSKNVRAYYNRGHAKSDLNDYAGAIVDFDEVLGLNPRNLEAKSSKAFLLSIAEDEAIRNPVDALRLAEEVLREYYGNGFAMNAKSCALAAKGDFKAAIALQESIADSDWINDEGIDGGAHAKARIAAWKSGQLWHP